MIRELDRKLGVSTKTSLLCGVIILVLLAVSSIVAIRFQSNASRLMIDGYVKSQNEEMEIFAAKQNESVREITAINLEICSNIASNFLYNFDNENLMLLLESFVKVDGMVAVVVTDADDNPFAAAWKEEEIRSGQALPDTLSPEEAFSLARDAVYEEAKVGGVRIYYTNRLVLAEIALKKNRTDQRISGFRDISAKSIRDAIKGQVVVAVCIVIALILTLVLSLRFIIATPIDRITREMNAGADQVTLAADQVASASMSLAQSTSEQAAAIDHTSSSMDKMADMTRRNADNAEQADQLMQDAKTVVSSANASMERVIASMDDISRASDETSKIIKTIDEIAFQTNLLALNAAVEAARAGEAGAGFAVVADEVRNLAMRAADAAKDTARLIESTVKKVDQGAGLVSDTNEAFAKVAESTEKVGALVYEIAESSKEQSGGIDQVNRAIGEIDGVVRRNAANSEESASASEKMKSEAVALHREINELIRLVKGAKSAESLQTAKAGPGTPTCREAPDAPRELSAKQLPEPVRDGTA